MSRRQDKHLKQLAAKARAGDNDAAKQLITELANGDWGDSLTEHIVVAKEAGAQNLAGYLVWLSTPFSVQPLPDDAYEFTVKTEVIDRVHDYCVRGRISCE